MPILPFIFLNKAGSLVHRRNSCTNKHWRPFFSSVCSDTSQWLFVSKEQSQKPWLTLLQPIHDLPIMCGPQPNTPYVQSRRYQMYKTNVKNGQSGKFLRGKSATCEVNETTNLCLALARLQLLIVETMQLFHILTTSALVGGSVSHAQLNFTIRVWRCHTAWRPSAHSWPNGWLDSGDILVTSHFTWELIEDSCHSGTDGLSYIDRLYGDYTNFSWSGTVISQQAWLAKFVYNRTRLSILAFSLPCKGLTISYVDNFVPQWGNPSTIRSVVKCGNNHWLRTGGGPVFFSTTVDTPGLT